MKVPLLDLKAQLATIESDVKAAVNEVIDSTRYIMGPKVEELEGKVAEYVGAEFAVGVSSGSDALLVSLMALDVGAGDIVITTPYSFFATAGAIARVGAIPVFVDIDPSTYNMSPESLNQWFESNTPGCPAVKDDPKADGFKRVKAIIPVHLYGQFADMEPILEAASKYNVPVIEDAAQAIGSQYPSGSQVKKAGSMGTTGCFSFFPSKNLGGIGDGGMVTICDSDLAEKIARLRNHGSKPKYYHSLIGGNFRLDPVQAAVLLVKLPHLEQWHGRRRQNAAYYDEHLKVEGIRTPPIAYARDKHIYNQYVISVPERRDELKAYLKDNDIGCEVYYPVPFHEQKCFQYLGYGADDFPNSTYAARHTLALPVYPELTEEMQNRVIEKIGEFYG